DRLSQEPRWQLWWSQSRGHEPGWREGVLAMGSEPEQHDTVSTTARFGAIAEGEELAHVDVPQPDLAAVEGLPPGHALLIVQRGPTAGARFLLDTERTLAGRHPTA